MQIPPASVIASWPTPNYTHPTETRGPAILVLTFILVPITLITVILRLYTRFYISRSPGLDDLFIIIALIATLGCSLLTVTAVLIHGWNRHVYDIRPDQISIGLKFVIALEVCFGFSTGFTKISLLCFLRKILSPGTTRIRTFADIAIGVVAIDTLILTIVCINTCSPVSAYWTLSIEPQHCINESAHLTYGGIINTLTDVWVVVLPIPVVLKLHLPRRQQMILFALFGAGFVTVFAGIFRLYYTHVATTTYDRTWESYPLWISGTVELEVGVIAASVPAIKPLLSKYLPKFLETSNTFMAQTSEHNSRAFQQTLGPFRDPEAHVELTKVASGGRQTIEPVVSTFSAYQPRSRSNDRRLFPPAVDSLPKRSDETSISSVGNVHVEGSWIR